MLIEGGTPLEATHRYAAMCRRLTLVMCSSSPSTTLTVGIRNWGLGIVERRKKGEKNPVRPKCNAAK